MHKDDRYADYKCPICESDSYVRIVVKKPNGDWYRTAFFQCFGCSVMFTDPKAFTEKRKHVRNGLPVMGAAHYVALATTPSESAG